MRQTAENVNAVQATMRRLVSVNGGRSLDPDYHAEIADTLLMECPSVAVLGAVTSDLLEFDRLPYRREVIALARKNTPERTGKFFDGCERGCDEGWYHFDRERNGVPYSFVAACSCRDGGGR